MKILLTGHRGFIGTALMEELKKQHEVTGIDLVEGDNLLDCKLPSINFDVIIHLAGRSGVRESIKNPTAYWINNIEASRRLFDQYPQTRIIYASSSSAYEPDLNPYAASKYILEKLASRYSNTLGLRLHTVYSHTPRAGMFFDKLINEKLEYVTTHSRDFLYITDCIKAIMLLLEFPNVNGVIDIGTGDAVSVRDLAPGGLEVKLHTPGEREHTKADIEPMSSLGWRPTYFVSDFLHDINKDK